MKKVIKPFFGHKGQKIDGNWFVAAKVSGVKQDRFPSCITLLTRRFSNKMWTRSTADPFLPCDVICGVINRIRITEFHPI